MEMSSNLHLLGNHPYYYATAFESRDMYDLWKGKEAKTIHSLLKKIDEETYRVHCNIIQYLYI